METRDTSATIRVSTQTRDRFAKLADATGRPMTELLDEAADALERSVFFDQLSARYEALRADPQAWGEIEAERAIEATSIPLVVVVADLLPCGHGDDSPKGAT
jgi:predicted transcriptional regulator